MYFLKYVIVGVISFLIANYLVPEILLVSLRKRLIDKPNKRKVHTVTSSRLGGVSFYPSIIVAVCITVSIASLFNRHLLSAAVSLQFLIASCACFIMYIVGLFDDIISIRYRQKFFFQLVAASLIVLSGLWIQNLYGFCGVHAIPFFIGMPLTMLLIVFIMNAINLIDGIDGLASGLSIIATLVYGLSFVYVNNTAQGLVAFATIGTLVAFIRYNVRGFSQKTLKIFMGDSGSLTIGTILAICAIKLTQYNVSITEGGSSLLLAYSALIVPCFDVLRVMLHRFRNHCPVFLPDRNHIHHKLLSCGFTARQSLLLILSISIAFILINVILSIFIWIEFVVIIDIILYTVMNVVISRFMKPELTADTPKSDYKKKKRQ